jgi:hypothetical protein
MNDAILTTATIRNLRKARLSASMGRYRYGTRPEVEVRFPRGTPTRNVTAGLYSLAALVELATPPHERWLVGVDTSDDEVAHVHLELMDDTDEEAARGLALLKRVVA